MRVALRRIATTDVIGAGTTLAVEDTGRPVHPSGEPGLWDSDTALRGGDSYTVKSYVPRPSPAQLTQSTSGKDARPTVDLDVTIPTEAEAPLPSGLEGASDAAAQPSEGRGAAAAAAARRDPLPAVRAVRAGGEAVRLLPDARRARTTATRRCATRDTPRRGRSRRG